LGVDFRLVEVRNECLAKSIHRFKHLVEQAGQGADHASRVMLAEKYGAQGITLVVRIVADGRCRDGLLEQRA
jgi:hypothetical protein